MQSWDAARGQSFCLARTRAQAGSLVLSRRGVPCNSAGGGQVRSDGPVVSFASMFNLRLGGRKERFTNHWVRHCRGR